MHRSTWTDSLARAARLARSLLSSRSQPSAPGAASSSETATRRPGRPAAAGPGSHQASRPTHDAYPGDFRGRVEPVYSPELDGDADPGEIVWTWVPYEEDHGQGKDRPVLVVGQDGDWLLGLMLTSKDHSRDRREDGPRWMDIGSGPWDARGRESEVRLDRVLRLDPAAVRREGAIMDRATFDRVVGAI